MTKKQHKAKESNFMAIYLVGVIENVLLRFVAAIKMISYLWSFKQQFWLPAYVQTPWARKVEIKVKVFWKAGKFYVLSWEQWNKTLHLIYWINSVSYSASWHILFWQYNNSCRFRTPCITDRRYKIRLFLYLFQLYTLRTSRKEIVDFSKAILK